MPKPAEKCDRHSAITMPCCVTWPVMPWTLKQISMVCMAPDRTIYIERIMDQ